MAIIFFRIFTENNPVMGSGKKYIKPDAKGLNRASDNYFVNLILKYLY